MVDTFPVDPILSFKFCVVVNGIGKIGCNKVSGLEESHSVVEYREGCDPTTMRKQPGMKEFPNVTLERGITTDSTQFLEWRARISKSQKADRRTVIIQVMGPTGDPVRTYTLYRAWPSNLKFSDLDASGSEVYMETLELVHEGLEVKVEAPA